MIKVKEFLDKNFFQIQVSTSELKKNGHYCVHGQWMYRIFYIKVNNETIILDISKKSMSVFYNTYSTISKFEISCFCNNETIQIHVIDNGKSIGKYSYLQTYEHLPRHPDEFGYYMRSTDEEVIKYIKSYMIPFIREEKLMKILE